MHTDLDPTWADDHPSMYQESQAALRVAHERIAALAAALRGVEEALGRSPLVKPYRREQEALEIARAALAPEGEGGG